MCTRRGQDEGSLFITVYAPGMKVEDAKIMVNDTHFQINGPNPTVSQSSPFRASTSVMASSITADDVPLTETE